jgi:hypothetical protein
MVTRHAPDIRSDLEPGAPEELVMLGERLRASRPLPSPAFRGQLGRTFEGECRQHTSPRRVRALITLYASTGTLLLAAGAISAAGLGPLS